MTHDAHDPPAERAGTEPATDEPTRESTPLFYAVSRDLRAKQEQDAASAAQNETAPAWPGGWDDHDSPPPVAAEQHPTHDEHAQTNEWHEIQAQSGRPLIAPMWTDPVSLQGHAIILRLRRLHAIDVDGPLPAAEAFIQLAAWLRYLAREQARHPAQVRGWPGGVPQLWTVVGVRRTARPSSRPSCAVCSLITTLTRIRRTTSCSTPG